MNRFSQAKVKRVRGIITILFGILFIVVEMSIFATTGMDIEKKIIQNEINEEYGGGIEITIDKSFNSSGEYTALSITKILFACVGLFIVAVGIFWVVSSYKMERRERDSVNYGQNYEQNRTYNLKGKVYNKDDNSLGF